MSISLDTDDGKWRDFVAKNEMTWIQNRDKGFDGKVATLFGVHAIPATFTIDADGVLQDQHVGDADIEGKLKKLIARAQALQKQTESQAQSTLAVPNPPDIAIACQSHIRPCTLEFCVKQQVSHLLRLQFTAAAVSIQPDTGLQSR